MKTKVAFLWNYDVQPIHLMYWWDGHRAAVEGLDPEKYDVQIFTLRGAADIGLFDPDILLVWGCIDNEFADLVHNYDCRKAYLYPGGSKTHVNYDKFDHVFYQSDVDGKEFKKLGRSTSKAYGTNTELFVIQKQPKVFDAIFPATFAAWKRHELFAEAMKGKIALACGFWQEVEEECRQVCHDAGLLTTKAVHPEVLVSLYNASHVTIATSSEVGGSQRTIMESLACGIPAVICKENEKCMDYVGSGGVFVADPDPESILDAWDNAMSCEKTPEELREWIMENYSEKVYRSQLTEWIDNGLRTAT